MTDKVDAAVRHAFAAAQENGYTFENWTVEEIADDMMDCDADIAEFSYVDVRRAIQNYRAAKAAETAMPGTDGTR